MSSELESQKIVDSLHTLDGFREVRDLDTEIYAREKKDILKTICSYSPDVVKDAIKKYNLACPQRKFSVSEFLPSDLMSYFIRWNDVREMNVKVEYVLEGLIPKTAITLLFGRGGIGKTTVALQIARAIAEGVPFGNLCTIKTPVYYIDFENPLPVLKERAVNIGQAENFYVWHLSSTPMPPRLDGADWQQYKQLPPGLIVFDTLRAANLSDENNSQDMALIIARLKELREIGFTVLLLHHTPKGNESIYKGSTALLDLVDHVLGFENVHSAEGVPVEFDADNLYGLGTRIKTRYNPYQIFLKFNPATKTFEIATDPEVETLEAICELLQDKGEMTTNEVYILAYRELGIKNKPQFLKLLKKGVGRYWTTEKRGRSVIYGSLVQPLKGRTPEPISSRGEKTSEPMRNLNSPQTRINTVEFNSSGGVRTDEPMNNESKKPMVQGDLWDRGSKNNAGEGTGEDMVI